MKYCTTNGFLKTFGYNLFNLFGENNYPLLDNTYYKSCGNGLAPAITWNGDNTLMVANTPPNMKAETTPGYIQVGLCVRMYTSILSLRSSCHVDATVKDNMSIPSYSGTFSLGGGIFIVSTWVHLSVNKVSLVRRGAYPWGGSWEECCIVPI